MESRFFELENGKFVLYCKITGITRAGIDETCKSVIALYQKRDINQPLLVLVDATLPSIILTTYIKQKILEALPQIPQQTGAVAVITRNTLLILSLRLLFSREVNLPYRYTYFSDEEQAKQWLIKHSEQLTMSSGQNESLSALIVDDDPRINKLLTKVLIKENFEVESFYRGDHVLTMLQYYHPKLIVLDMFLPGVNGFQILKHIRSSKFLTDTVVITVSADASVFETLQNGANYALQKPVSPREFSEILKEVTGNFSAEKVSFNNDFDLNGKHILVIDDEPDSVYVLRALLEKCGAKVFTATNGREGFHIAQTEVPDLIFTDIFMPEIDGWEFIDLIKQFPPTVAIPVVAVTAHTERSYRQQAKTAGFHHFIGKPINPNMFMDKLKVILA